MIATNDVFAVGAMIACREAGVRIPDDVSITGVDDPRGIAVTPDGQRTYVSTSSGRIDVYDPSGSTVSNTDIASR